MTKRYELDHAKEAIKSALLPLQCSVDDIDAGNSILVKVFDDNGRSLLEGGVKILKSDACSPKIGTGLPTKIVNIRKILAHQGHKLSKWASNDLTQTL